MVRRELPARDVAGGQGLGCRAALATAVGRDPNHQREADLQQTAAQSVGVWWSTARERQRERAAREIDRAIDRESAARLCVEKRTGDLVKEEDSCERHEPDEDGGGAAESNNGQR